MGNCCTNQAINFDNEITTTNRCEQNPTLQHIKQTKTQSQVIKVQNAMRTYLTQKRLQQYRVS